MDWLSRRPAALEIAAFNTCGKEGFIPQLKQGRRGVCEFAVAGSKLGVTGLANEQITQTHVAFVDLVELGPGLELVALCWRGEGLELREEDCNAR